MHKWASLNGLNGFHCGVRARAHNYIIVRGRTQKELGGGSMGRNNLNIVLMHGILKVMIILKREIVAIHEDRTGDSTR